MLFLETPCLCCKPVSTAIATDQQCFCAALLPQPQQQGGFVSRVSGCSAAPAAGQHTGHTQHTRCGVLIQSSRMQTSSNCSCMTPAMSVVIPTGPAVPPCCPGNHSRRHSSCSSLAPAAAERTTPAASGAGCICWGSCFCCCCWRQPSTAAAAASLAVAQPARHAP